MHAIDVIMIQATMAAWFTWFSKPTPTNMWAWVAGAVIYHGIVKPFLTSRGLM